MFIFCFIKFTPIPVYLQQIQHMNTGTKCKNMRQLAVLQSIFGTPEKLLVHGFRLPLVPCESPSHGEPLWFSAGPFLMQIILFPNVQFMWFFSICPAWHSLFSCCRFSPPDFVLIFYFFLICFMAIQSISNAGIVFTWVHFNKTKSAWPEQLVFWFLMFFLI